MKRLIVSVVITLFVGILFITSCVHPAKTIVVTPDDGNFPPAIAKIIISKCAISGCHNAASYGNSDDLLLDSWEHMFKGSSSGAVVVAYSPRFSPLMYFVNTDSSMGPMAMPTMPESTTTMPQNPLSKEEYMTLYNWIASGAPDKNGNIPFAADADNRQKIYLTCQGCDQVAVIDGSSKLLMRYIPVGTMSSQIESPHDIEVSSDGAYAYIPLFNGNYVQKIDTRKDTVVASVDISSRALAGSGSWSIINLSPMDTSLMVSGWIANGCIVNINTANMQVNAKLSVDNRTGGTDQFPFPHGLASNATFDTFYATLQNNLIKYSFNHLGIISYEKNINASGNPHGMLMTPDYSRYIVTCPSTTGSNEVRIYDAHTDTLLKAIPVGLTPQELDIAPSRGYVFVACMEDAANPLPGRRGSVYVIDYNNLSIVKILYGDFYQPHGVSVDEQDGLLYIPSRNQNPDGPAPHHATACTGRAGWYSVYNLNTLEPADGKRYEVTVDPYSIKARFH